MSVQSVGSVVFSRFSAWGLFSFGLAFGAMADNMTYYWVGTNGATFHVKSNWADVNGKPAADYPYLKDTVVFTNSTALSLAASTSTKVDTYLFQGSGDVTIGRNQYYLRNNTGNGGIFATGTGVYSLDYTVNAEKELGEYPVEVAKDATVYLSSYGTTQIADGAVIVKRGAGNLQCGTKLNWQGGIKIEEGYVQVAVGGGLETGSATTLMVDGTDAKYLYCKGDAIKDLRIPHYVESPEAAGTLTWEGYRSAGAVATLSGAADSVTRFSADFFNNVGTVGFQLVWDPQVNAVLDIVKRNYNQSSASIKVKSGTVRFSDGAGVTKMKGIQVCDGATLEIAADAGTVSAPMTLDVGATLTVKKTFIPAANLTWNGTVRLESGWFPCSSGAQSHPAVSETSDLLIAGADTKTYYVYGNQSITLRNYAETPEAEMTALLEVYTGSSPVLTFKGTQDTRLSADIYNTASGTYTLRWQPTSAKTMSIVKRVYNNSTTGFQVGSGTLRVAEGAAFKTTNGVSVESGATLAIAADAGSDWSKTDLKLAAGANVSFEGEKAIRVRSVTVDGTTYTDGLFSADNASWITGAGVLAVGEGKPSEPETVACTWTGGGATSAFDDPANWGGTLPNLTDGSLVATFPAGAAATLPAAGSVCLKGLVAQGGLTLSGGQFRLGSAGLTTPGSGETVTIDCAVAVYSPQTWSVGAKDRLVFTEKGVIGSFWPRCVGRVHKLTWNGGDASSAIELWATSADLWDVDSYVQVIPRADNALGGAGARFRACQVERIVKLYGNTFANDFEDAADANTTSATLFNVMSGANVICGKVSGTSSNIQYWHFDNSSGGTASVTFRGGYTYTANNNNSLFSPIHNGTVTFTDVPFSATRIMFGYLGYYSNVANLNVASNVTTRGIVLQGWSVLNTTVKDALFATDDGQSGVVMNADTVWNLSADQGVNVLSVAGSPKIASTNGATLTLRDDRLNTVKTTELFESSGYRLSLCTEVVKTNAAVFAGNVNFVKAGKLDLWLDGESTSTGCLTVSGGRLVFRHGSWRQAQSLNVAGGRVRFENKAVTKATDIVVTGDANGVIEIPAGMKLRCKSLTVNGTPVADGIVQDGVVTGGGTLAVGQTGAYLILR